MMKPTCVLVFCVGACAFMPGSYVGNYQRSKYTILHGRCRVNKYSNDDYDNLPSSENMEEECSVEHLYDEEEETKKEKRVDDFKLNITLFDCFMALVFGGQWSAGFFWKAVQERIIKDSIKVVLCVGVIYGIYSNIDFTDIDV